jgi:cyclase
VHRAGSGRVGRSGKICRVTSFPYDKGLQEVATSVYAYLQPDGSWGWSNAGLIAGGETTMLVDTLFDLRLTREMLDAMRRAVPAAGSIDTLVNTHGDPDHTFGNQLVDGAQIIASARAAQEMLGGEAPEALRGLMAAAPQMGAAGEYILRSFSAFDFDGITLVAPTRTFDGALELAVGDVRVSLIEVGPAHTRGDTLIHLPRERVLFAGDILFAGGHPVIWDGSVSGWIAACERILAMDVDVIVPGHGPITGKAGVRELRDYLLYVAAEAERAQRAGLPVGDAAARIDLSPYAGWGNPERVVMLVDAVYRSLAGDESRPDRLALIGAMGSR